MAITYSPVMVDMVNIAEGERMNLNRIGERVEEVIKNAYNLSDDHRGFDASFCTTPIEIKSCARRHLNGLNSRGEQNYTKGRFWIDNKAHKLLLAEDGLYYFVLYRYSRESLKIIRVRTHTARYINSMINKGSNTKIRYDRILHNSDAWRDLCQF